MQERSFNDVRTFAWKTFHKKRPIPSTKHFENLTPLNWPYKCVVRHERDRRKIIFKSMQNQLSKQLVFMEEFCMCQPPTLLTKNVRYKYMNRNKYFDWRQLVHASIYFRFSFMHGFSEISFYKFSTLYCFYLNKVWISEVAYAAWRPTSSDYSVSTFFIMFMNKSCFKTINDYKMFD